MIPSPLVALSVLTVSLFGFALVAAADDPPDEPRPAFWQILEQGAAKAGMQADFDAVMKHMARVPRSRGRVSGRLECVERGLTEPWSVPAMSEELEAALGAPIGGKRGFDFSFLAPAARVWLDYPGNDELKPEGADALAALEESWELVADPEVVGEALLDGLSELMGSAHAALYLALGELDEPALELLFNGYLPFAEAHYRDHFPDEKLSEEQSEALKAFIDTLLKKQPQDRVLILGVAEVLLRLGDPGFTGSLKKRLRKCKNSGVAPGVDGDVLAVVGTDESNRVVLCGRKTTRHAVASALVIDLGGRDEYGMAASAVDGARLASIVIDLGGDDAYGTPSSCGVAHARGGVAMLFDLKGDDTYVAGRGGQGSAVLGFALLADAEGDDTYTMEDYGQGHALCGIGLLYDAEGNDTYTAWAFAQGGGIGSGLAALVDGGGDDSYLADLKWPDVYGNSGPEIYHGASQGYSTGLRPSVAGGIAACIDLGDGEDRYQSGNFSQGGGYYFAFGLLVDSGGDDENFGTRYSQGFGVHQGIALRRDRGGDDSYVCRSVAHCGMAWDEGVGYFIEEGGDDTYSVGDLGLGGAAQTGVAIFLDLGGKDSYRSGREGQGGTGAAEYHNKPSLGLFVDLGGKSDSYSSTVDGDKRGDKACVLEEGVGVFLDTKAKTFEKALKDKALR